MCEFVEICSHAIMNGMGCGCDIYWRLFLDKKIEEMYEPMFVNVYMCSKGRFSDYVILSAKVSTCERRGRKTFELWKLGEGF